MIVKTFNFRLFTVFGMEIGREDNSRPTFHLSEMSRTLRNGFFISIRGSVRFLRRLLSYFLMPAFIPKNAARCRRWCTRPVSAIDFAFVRAPFTRYFSLKHSSKPHFCSRFLARTINSAFNSHISISTGLSDHFVQLPESTFVLLPFVDFSQNKSTVSDN